MYSSPMSGSENASMVAQEILDQPRAWARAVELAGNSVNPFPRGERVAIIGCGSSWHTAKAIAAMREASGQGETDAFAASEALLDRSYDRIFAISRSGTTTEVLQALESRSGDSPVTAVVGDPVSPLAAISDQVLDLTFADDQSVVQSRFVTTVLCLARTFLGEDTGSLPGRAEEALVLPHPVEPRAAERAVVLAQGWRVGIADAAALALRETAQMWAESYPSMEYRHGPIATAGPGAVVWFLDEPPAGLADQVLATGALVVEAEGDPITELIRIQRLAVAKAEGAGFDPDRPPNLDRAVVLEAEGPSGGGR